MGFLVSYITPESGVVREKFIKANSDKEARLKVKKMISKFQGQVLGVRPADIGVGG